MAAAKPVKFIIKLNFIPKVKSSVPNSPKVSSCLSTPVQDQGCCWWSHLSGSFTPTGEFTVLARAKRTEQGTEPRQFRTEERSFVHPVSLLWCQGAGQRRYFLNMIRTLGHVVKTWCNRRCGGQNICNWKLKYYDQTEDSFDLQNKKSNYEEDILNLK